MRRTSLLGTLLIANVLMATRLSLTFSRSIPPLLLTRTSCSISNLKQFPKSHPCPLWSSSFSFCLHRLHKSTSPLRASSFSSSPFMAASSPNGVIEDNPLLQNFDFPPFDVVEPKHVRPGIRALLGELERELEDLERNVEPSWPKLVEPLEKIVDRLSVVWGMVNHLKAVKDSSELRSAIEDVQAEKVKFQLRLGQSKPIYNAFKAIRESPDWQTLSDARKRIVESQIKEAVLNGVSLEDDKRESFNKIEQELEKLSQKFGENVLDATKKFEKLITDKKEIEGLPATALGLAAQSAVTKGHENATAENGPWVITLDAPSFIAVMQHARDRSLREEIYRAYVSRASTGDLDNTEIINQILKLRLEKAKLLNYNNYAEVSMATKMATVDKAEELLEKLRRASWDPAVQDIEDLKEFSKSQDALEASDLTHWDITFWSERLRESKYDINEVSLLHYLSYGLERQKINKLRMLY
ncbi:organellar oligopeptidase A, chloroplastic/mitochondrial-like [Vigna umbellata]|uniref:organellar oligopeptidase A, chloroplastic/mitochondrial-like n=1 Tax=Vigna umbellata TaxID=87088 RepID=UPI001F5F015A|nr:organellar oligopeptidase A, chloroplastic/mitochondrial-like [Vigna umbellata]